MRRHAPRIITAVLAALLLLSGWKTARAAAVWIRAPHAGERTGRATPRDAPVRAEAAPALAEIARSRRALVFVYLPDCQVCHSNMANWIDLVRETRGAEVELYAVAAVDDPRALEYWRGLERHVRVLAAAPRAVHGALGVANTPATLLVQEGRVRGQILGALTPAGRAEVLRFTRGGPAPEEDRER
jgi:plasmid stabilization system protein ParE